ncbi:MAG: CHAT domain-containing protein [Reyranella sp.]|uniref:CHAT domain-containing tetratricopeptide repeat protein n=1 Tax=Reyranella sp. TaxID=1929291 RepID=UPI0012128ECA|nr:CHAT domain-containing protein [Reyranella sp.]TAJ35614.1 MAG: CHAT domain-containing protein [Reyranella sp.]
MKFGVVLGLVFVALAPLAAIAQQAPAFVAPPRSVADIAAILDQEKPDPARVARLQARASAEPATGLNDGALAAFYFDRALARSELGRGLEAIADAEKSVELRRKLSRNVFTQQQFIAAQYTGGFLGDPKPALVLLTEMEKAHPTSGWTDQALLNIYRHIITHLVSLGDFKSAEAYLAKSDAFFEAKRNGPKAALVDSSFEADLEFARAWYLGGLGRHAESEAAYAKSEVARRDSMEKSDKWPDTPPRASFLRTIDATVVRLGRAKALQGRVAEAEVDVRRALLSQLGRAGRYHPVTLTFVSRLAEVLIQQGRYPEAERLARIAVETLRTIGFAEDSFTFVAPLNQLASTLYFQGRWSEAAEVQAAIDKATAGWESDRRDFVRLTPARIYTLYNTGQLVAGVDRAREMIALQRRRVGENHINYAIARGILAEGLARLGRDPAALEEFRAAIPVLASQSRAAEDDDSSTVAARHLQVRNIVEAYIGLLARGPASADTAATTFALADTVRGRSVGTAVAAASARVTSNDPVLSALTRHEQDLRKQMGASLGTLNNLLSLPVSGRDEASVAQLREQIARLGREHEAARLEIGVRFPDYAELIDPKPATVEQTRNALRTGETFLSFYFGRDKDFVWAVPKEGPVLFAEIAAPPQEIEARIRKLRESLEPNASTIAEIPAYDTALAYDLYALLLKPVEAAWKPARNLIVATNGSLGLLPLGALPVEPVVAATDAGTAFANYRKVAWLARTHAVTMMPSAAALRTLRQLQPGSAKREPVIGFGDPFFNRQQATEAQKLESSTPATSGSSRDTPLDRRSSPRTEGLASAGISELPRLPDTADELRSVALALRSDPAHVLNMGKSADEETVKRTDLSNYRVVMFATHGLVPGELDGLHQPALALSAPDVTGQPGDGLLTLDEILALKLDADWVVLSACNTGAGDGAGAEAASGLGRAFFYAGTRAILVTNWSVHSQSARELVTDIFRRQAADPKLARAEALRLAMLGVMDGPGYLDDKGKPLFTYAHPLFWAPYSIIGDGG